MIDSGVQPQLVQKNNISLFRPAADSISFFGTKSVSDTMDLLVVQSCHFGRRVRSGHERSFAFDAQVRDSDMHRRR